MANPLMNVPGLAGYLQQRQGAQQEEALQLQQFGQVAGLRNALIQQEQAKRMLALKEQEATRQAGQGQPIGAGGLRLPDGTIVAPVARPDTGLQGPEIVQLQAIRKKYIDAGAPADSPAIKELDARITKLNAPSSGLTVNMPGSSDMMQGEDGKYYRVRIGKDGKVETIPLQTEAGGNLQPPAKTGSEAGLTPENAGKVAMAEQAIGGVDTVSNLMFDKEGNLNKGLVLAMSVPGTTGLPGNTNARIARSAIRNAVEAKLRMETGAAATEPEINRTLDRFMPTIGDTKESAKFKLKELQDFFKSTLSQVKGMKKGTPNRMKFDAQGNLVQ